MVEHLKIPPAYCDWECLLVQQLGQSLLAFDGGDSPCRGNRKEEKVFI